MVLLRKVWNSFCTLSNFRGGGVKVNLDFTGQVEKRARGLTSKGRFFSLTSKNPFSEMLISHVVSWTSSTLKSDISCVWVHMQS